MSPLNHPPVHPRLAMSWRKTMIPKRWAVWESSNFAANAKGSRLACAQSRAFAFRGRREGASECWRSYRGKQTSAGSTGSRDPLPDSGTFGRAQDVNTAGLEP